MNEKIDYSKCISDEQYDALATELLPLMITFFNSQKGKEIFADYNENKLARDEKAA